MSSHIKHTACDLHMSSHIKHSTCDLHMRPGPKSEKTYPLVSPLAAPPCRMLCMRSAHGGSVSVTIKQQLRLGCSAQ